MRKIGSIWLSGLVVSFGLVTLGSTWMRTRADIYASRILLGFTEGGVLVCIYYFPARGGLRLIHVPVCSPALPISCQG